MLVEGLYSEVLIRVYSSCYMQRRVCLLQWQLLHFLHTSISILTTQVSEGHHRRQAHQSKRTSELTCLSLPCSPGILLQRARQLTCSS